jgi:predicted transposase YdaD
MKRLVKTYAPHFTNWLMAQATFVRTLNVELQSQQLFVDALIEISKDGEPGLLLIEFQSYRDPEMGRRVAEYSVIASRENHHWEVSPYVIFLRKVGEVDQPPYIRRHRDGWEEYRFNYHMIQLWELPAEFFLQHGWLGLLPLVILTRGGKRPNVVDQVVEKLTQAQEYDLLALTRLLGGLVYKERTDESEWFKRRFHMFQDILRESWVYEEIGQEYFEQGIRERYRTGHRERD